MTLITPQMNADYSVAARCEGSHVFDRKGNQLDRRCVRVHCLFDWSRASNRRASDVRGVCANKFCVPHPIHQPRGRTSFGAFVQTIGICGGVFRQQRFRSCGNGDAVSATVLARTRAGHQDAHTEPPFELPRINHRIAQPVGSLAKTARCRAAVRRTNATHTLSFPGLKE